MDFLRFNEAVFGEPLDDPESPCALDWQRSCLIECCWAEARCSFPEPDRSPGAVSYFDPRLDVRVVQR
jgi:hypothetical protein